MADASAEGTTSDVRLGGPEGAHDGLEELRQLLFGEEEKQLRDLQRRVNGLAALPINPAEIGTALPEAIVLRPQPDAQLTQALAPTVEAALKVSVKKDPQPLVDAIFPIIGPAIRKAIATALKTTLQSLNQTLEYSMSLRGLRWRLEAWQTGRPFAEVVLWHTLVYRVEQVFLIHRNTGLLLQHVVSEALTTPHAALVSGMLTAIQDFVRDSFGATTQEALESFQVGEFTVWVEQGPEALLAVVIRGTPPYTLRQTLQETLEAIHREQWRAFVAFTGDPAPFTVSQPHLEACLVTQAATAVTRISPWLIVGATLCLLGGGAWLFRTVRAQQRWTAYVQRLNAEPGIVVTSATAHRGKYVLWGLRDPLAADPVQLLGPFQLTPEAVTTHWESYHAYAPAFVLARARAALQPPETVTLHLEDGVLVARGVASHEWMATTRLLVRALAGIMQYRDSELLDTDTSLLRRVRERLSPPDTVTLQVAKGRLTATGIAPHRWIVQAAAQVPTIPGVIQYSGDALVDSDHEAFVKALAQVQQTAVLFPENDVVPAPGQDETLQEVSDNLQQLFLTAETLGKRVQVTVVGHTDARGSETFNQGLSQARAERTLALLKANGLHTADLIPVGMAAKERLSKETTEKERAMHRRVSFRVHVTDEP